VSGLTLTLRTAPRQRVDASALLPETLAGMTPGAIAALTLPSGNGTIAVGDLFAIEAGDASELVIAGDASRLDFIGCGMTSGRIAVDGPAGAHAGQAMRGGTLAIAGDAGPWAGAAMAGGLLTIGGSAGDRLGGAPPAALRGMSGGLIVVRGAAGARAGDRQRRGVILVEGDLDGAAGARMLAGTLIGLGAAGPNPGAEMKRGTLILAAPPAAVLPSFADSGRHELAFLRLLFRYLEGHSAKLAGLAAHWSNPRRLVGDRAGGGQGEILLP
jgi:formylmethanofuran dehydrogenase subunit C